MMNKKRRSLKRLQHRTSRKAKRIGVTKNRAFGVEKRTFNQGYDTGYDKGFDAGCQYADKDRLQLDVTAAYNSGFDAGHDAGYGKGYSDGTVTSVTEYDRGRYEGGEAWIDQLLPTDYIVPEVTVNQVIAEGLRQLEGRFIRMLSSREVANDIQSALDRRASLSIVRLGDGELLTLCQDTILSIDEVRARGDFLAYAGIQVPDLAARDQLVEAIAKADIVGVPKQRLKNFQPLLVPALNALGLDHRQMRLTFSTINYSLYYDGYLPKLMEGKRVLAVGNQAQVLTDYLTRNGISAAPPVTPVEGMKDVARVVEQIRERSFDLAIVSAGVAAVPIVQRIALEMGRVAVDFGHLADMIANGTA
jgi:hypothetical protein